MIQQKHAVEYAYRLDAAVNRLTAATLGAYENLVKSKLLRCRKGLFGNGEGMCPVTGFRGVEHSGARTMRW